MPLQIKPMLSANKNTFPVKQLSIKGIAMAMRIAGHSSVIIGDWLGEKLPVSFNIYCHSRSVNIACALASSIEINAADKNKELTNKLFKAISAIRFAIS